MFLRYLIINFILVISVALLVYFKGDSDVPGESEIGFWGSLAFIVVATLILTIGSFVGGLFANFTRPDAILTSGAGDTFIKKIFWMVGPQIIGAVIAIIIFSNLIMKLKN